ncbi:MAG: 1,4-alpha-glucan branching protein GlgB [Spartobacteria bacterium]|nr:1,4-alpha-glucan branching protein GlgB [Spartobacteria bacterium]
MKSELAPEVISSIENGMHGAPFDVLGMHTSDGTTKKVVVRSFQPYAKEVHIIEKKSGKEHKMARVGDKGLFEWQAADRESFAYLLKMVGYDDHEWESEDPYCFGMQISDFDLYLFGEGTNYRTYTKMGAHPMTIDGVDGVHFAVWAPNALRVSIIGWFNRWDGRHHPMQQRGSSGLWELFIPALTQGDLYKYEIKGPNGFLGQKADPFGFAAELRPRTASMVWDHGKYTWADKEWMTTRKETRWLEKPISTYELHLGSWRRVPEEGNRWLTYRELAAELIPYVTKLGFTHIEVLPVSEHPFDGSWGYQTIGYFAPTSRFGSPDDFKYFVDQCHKAGIAVIVDWVPAHFPKDGHGLGYFDGTHLYEHADPRQGEHRDWGTLIFNYGRNEVRTFLLSNAVFWADMYHIDGLRVDAVASMLYLDYSREAGEWIPNEYGGRENLQAVDFLKKFNEVIHEQYPGFTTYAEESTAWPMVSRPTYLGGLGFDFKWNMGWMHDTLQYFEKECIYRKYHHNNITFSLLYAFTENFILPFSHDEVVHGKGSMLDKMPGDAWQKFANLRVLLSYMYAHPGKKLLFQGVDVAQWSEWNYQSSVDWSLCQFDPHKGMTQCLTDLNHLYTSQPELHEIDFSWDGFKWIDFHDSDQSSVAFMRRGKNPDEFIVCVFNFTPVPRENFRMGVPVKALYKEIFNSDSSIYGGGNIGNAGAVMADEAPWQEYPYSLSITLPPLAGVFFRVVGEKPADK